jgi:hypothetical protein
MTAIFLNCQVITNIVPTGLLNKSNVFIFI